jgi:hypothetical protein
MSSESLKPQFFVTRQNGNMVPLIALDELPTTVEIRDVKRTLTPYDIAGMTSVGNHDTRHLKYVVDIPATLNTSTLIDRSLMASKFATAGSEHHLSRPSTPGVLYQGPPKAYGIQEQAPSSINPAAPAYGSAPVSASTPLRIDRNANPQAKARAQQPLPPWHDPSALPDTVKCAPGVKEFCSYWLRHGECDYAQQGCLYKHEMPLDQPTLQRLGLRDIPRWYRERHGLGSYLSANVTLGGSDAEDAATKANPKREMMGKDWRRGGAGRKLSQTELEGLRGGFVRMGNQGGENVKTSSLSLSRPQRNTGVPGPPPTTPQIPTSNLVSAREYYANGTGNKRQSQPQVLKPVNSVTRPFESFQDMENRKTILKHQEKENERAQRIALLQKRTNDVEDRPSTASSTRSKDSASGTGSTTPTDRAEAATPATSTEVSDNELLLDSPVPAQVNVNSTGAKTMTILQPQPKAPERPVLKPVRGVQSHSHTKTQAIKPSKSASASTSTSTGKDISTAEKRISTRKSRRRAAGESDADLESLGNGKKLSLQGAYDHDD